MDAAKKELALGDESGELRAKFEKEYGEVWTTNEMTAAFEVMGFAYGCCVVVRKKDKQRGSLDFNHLPRYYHSFVQG